MKTRKKYTVEDLYNLEALWKERTNAVCRSIINYCKELQRQETGKELYDDRGFRHSAEENPVIFLLDQIILEATKYQYSSPGEKIANELRKISEIKEERL